MPQNDTLLCVRATEDGEIELLIVGKGIAEDSDGSTSITIEMERRDALMLVYELTARLLETDEQ